MQLVVILTILILVGFMGFVRFSKNDPAQWNVEPAAALSEIVDAQVRTLTGGAVMRLSGGRQTLERLAETASATARTSVFAGSVPEGRITWITRSALWGFPDFTTAQEMPDGTIAVWARLRFGEGDMGVNAARLRAWKDAL